ncbi:MAG: type I glutamate--ammonia ligase [Ardenticatenaceae bacterium]|nr:type I glutamate--ammonia ligase [Ardenticatenaceae bacterium]HBY93849.1 type I glutamate--ammonia ligase [Chloroflexota bacterium]
MNGNGATYVPLRTPQEVLEFATAQELQIVDIKFCDLIGTWQHFSIPASQLSEELFTDGVGFDGSSIRGFQRIDESDMLLVADPTTAFVDPACRVPTLSVVCNVFDPITRQPYSRDPRYIAQKAERYLTQTGIADISYWGPEAEFFIFDDIRFDSAAHYSYYFVDSDEGIWNSGRDGNGTRPNLGHRPRWKEGYFPVPPADTLQDLRSEITLKMIQAGIDVEVHHHEVATGGQNEIDMRFDSLTRMADKLLLYKYIVKNVALAHGKTATFMPKPLFGDNGSGMHVHQSLWKESENLFYDTEGYALLSETARWYIGGILKHSPALLAFVAPTTNSYRRLVPGFEAPVNLIYSQRNRSAGVRIPMYSTSPKAKRIEYRCPDASCNPYLAFSAILLAGLDGIQNRIDPGEPLDKDLYDLEAEEAAQIKQVPGSLTEALDALEADYEFLLKGDVFTADVIETWIAYKRAKEVDPVRLRPHPYEFFLYYDA